MSERTVHLLQLPREVRDHIFSYLWRHIEFDWRWNCWPLSGADGIATVRMEDVPYSSLLLTNTQLYDEYSACARYCAPAITLNVCLGNDSFYRREDARYRGLMDQVLPRISCLSILIYNKRPGDNMTRHFWFEVYLLGQVLRDQSPCLKHFELTAYAPPSPSKEERLRRLAENKIPSVAYVPPPRHLGNSFLLVQHVEDPCPSNGNERIFGTEGEDTIGDDLSDTPESQGMVLMGKWIYVSTKVG